MTAELPADLRAAVITLAQTQHLLVALDFDGTMAPIVDRAEDARPLPRSAAALAALAALEGTTTALVSGRALASLRVVAAPPEPTLLVGSHGAEVQLGPGSAELKPSRRQHESLAEARAAVEEAVERFPGTMAEHKPAGVVLHYRQASETDGQAAVELVNGQLAHNPAFTITTGKMVLEISVVSANKGEGLATLRESTQATATFFAGDDVTDEHAFAALLPGDVGVKVGQGGSLARFRIESPHELPALLELLLAARSNGGTHNA
ncbi:trehalose-phosphatase [Arthrobacter sp. HLT1-20]